MKLAEVVQGITCLEQKHEDKISIQCLQTLITFNTKFGLFCPTENRNKKVFRYVSSFLYYYFAEIYHINEISYNKFLFPGKLIQN